MWGCSWTVFSERVRERYLRRILVKIGLREWMRRDTFVSSVQASPDSSHLFVGAGRSFLVHVIPCFRCMRISCTIAERSIALYKV